MKRLWIEDDCTRNTEGHETLQMAWKKLFNAEYDQKKQDRQNDLGDCIEHVFGNIVVRNVFGAWYEIWESP